MSDFDDDDFVLPSKISDNSDNSRENSEENNEEYEGDPKLNPILKCEKKYILILIQLKMLQFFLLEI